MEPRLLTFLESLNSLDQYGPEVFFFITKYIPRSVFLCFDSYNNKAEQPSQHKSVAQQT